MPERSNLPLHYHEKSAVATLPDDLFTQCGIFSDFAVHKAVSEEIIGINIDAQTSATRHFNASQPLPDEGLDRA